MNCELLWAILTECFCPDRKLERYLAGSRAERETVRRTLEHRLAERFRRWRKSRH
jgi:hypothetical protein